jgi:hypothetical protein
MGQGNKTQAQPCLKDSVERFSSFFRDKLQDIASIPIGKSGGLFQKILYNGFLDALSVSVASAKKGNRERLVSLITHFSGWAQCDRISLPHIIQLLLRVPDPEFSKLREYAFSLYDKWQTGATLNLDRDPPFEEVRELWPRTLPKPIEDVCLESFQHVHLFYSCRNSLIHEFREPGYGMEVGPTDEPFYHSMVEPETENYNWELVYPVGFFRKLCETTLARLGDYYLKNRIDPYSRYTFGSSWITALNV